MSSKDSARIKLVSSANQMSLIRDTEEVIKFLEFAAKKSILNEHAVNCRLTACHNLFSVVQEEEDNVENMLANLEVLIHRFHNRNTSVQASTLKVYKSRVKSSLEDYKAWSADPFAWERSLTEKAKQTQQERKSAERKPKGPKKAAAIKEKVETAKTPALEVSESTSVPPSGMVSFPIRPGTRIHVSLPEDGITMKELQRLCWFLYPYCVDMDFNQMGFGTSPFGMPSAAEMPQ